MFVNTAGLFQRIDTVYQSRFKSPDEFSKEQLLLIERVHLDFVRAGAKFDSEAQLKYGKIMENLATLTTKFSQVRVLSVAYEVLNFQRFLKEVHFFFSFSRTFLRTSLYLLLILSSAIW